MEKRRLGKSNLYVSPLCFGGNIFGWTIDEKTSFELLDSFTASGFNFIDTADVYSKWVPGNKGGESETIIGKWMKTRNNRDKVIIATKVGSDMGQGRTNVSQKYILKEVEDSLKRLQTDYIDLYQTHKDVLETPVEETLEAYAQLVKEGKIRWIGASNFSGARLLASLEASKKKGFPSYQTLQPQYNLYDRENFEKELEQICLNNDLSVISYYSLASGFLTGKYRSEVDLNKSTRGGGIRQYLNKRGFAILKALDEVSAQYHTTQASVALAWLIARPAVTAPIASATSLAQLDSLVSAAQLELSKDAIEVLNKASNWD
jgi:aryl-alcohol dehydrogenase-like predicted oxidoreductase